MTEFNWDKDHLAYAKAHPWAVLATGRKDGSPQQSMVGYAIDDQGRVLVSAKAYTAKWNNAIRQPHVSVAVPDGRTHLVVYGTAEPIETEPLRSQLTAEVFGAFLGEVPDPDSLVDSLDEQRRTVLRITPVKTLLHE